MNTHRLQQMKIILTLDLYFHVFFFFVVFIHSFRILIKTAFIKHFVDYIASSHFKYTQRLFCSSFRSIQSNLNTNRNFGKKSIKNCPNEFIIMMISGIERDIRVSFACKLINSVHRFALQWSAYWMLYSLNNWWYWHCWNFICLNADWSFSCKLSRDKLNINSYNVTQITKLFKSN